ncbi:hypothetical protein ACIQMZ_37180 [Streptomyces longwoodensis]|uniref:hypothetical protein n=1 Tax=Streptomyces longwoodensis TaxID=68231 RepID=UPI00381BDAFA
MTDEFPHVPSKCRNHACGHTPGHCYAYRSPGCVSGLCRHADHGLACGVRTDTAETRTQHITRRAAELRRLTKAQLIDKYRSLGGRGGYIPVEKWPKDDVLSAVLDREWDRLPESAKIPDPPLMSPPCDECGKGQHARVHGGGDGRGFTHNYRNTHDPDQQWVPAYDPPAGRMVDGPGCTPAEVQPSTEGRATTEQV